MLKRFKENYNHSHLQFILTDTDGAVVESDGTILKVQRGTQISELHPFFIGISEAVTSLGKSTVFRCIQLGSPEELLTVDIEISKREDYVLIVVYDLTDHYREYQAMAQSRNESVIGSERILMKNNELEERERFKNEFIQNFSHELRNPLTNIISLTNILGRTNLTTEQERILQTLKDSTSNLKLLLEDILSISMIAKGKLALNPTVFDFTHFLDFLKLTYRTRAKEKGLVFTITADEDIPTYIEGDRLRLLQVLTNLCDNGIKYTNEGRIALHVGLNQRWANTLSLRFGVRDTGKGIPPESLETIFQSFEQLAHTEGVGLGLAIVKGLLNLMGTTIKIESVVGKGSHFYFDVKLNFPLHQPDPVLQDRPRRKKIRLPSENGSKFKVLLVEDDEQIQAALFKILVDAGDFFIDVIGDGALVIEDIVKNAYDIVLMDVNLPNVPGHHLVSTIRDFPVKRIKKIPVVGVTAYSYKEQINTCLESGMNAVLAKPFDEDELLTTMYRLLK